MYIYVYVISLSKGNKSFLEAKTFEKYIIEEN